MASLPLDIEQLLSGINALPLVQSQMRCDVKARGILSQDPRTLFPKSRHPQAAMAGLVLRLGCWAESHEIAQDVSSTEGSYWHAILHRMEPDPFNAAYWFRRVARHPVFPELREQAHTILTEYPTVRWKLKSDWDPMLFIEWCEQGERQGGEVQTCAEAIHNAEWSLLFEWCAATE